jgi:hypothetical protein
MSISKISPPMPMYMNSLSVVGDTSYPVGSHWKPKKDEQSSPRDGVLDEFFILDE